MTVLHSRDLAVGYRHRRQPATVVLDRLDLALRPGELTCLLGPNGSGKSTLLRTLAGMQAPLHGEVTLLGDDVGRLPAVERARRLAVVLTDPVDAGLLTGADLVALGRYPYTGWSGRLSAADRAAVAWALEAVDATRFASRRVAELSDGERQRTAIARALAQQPAVLALDEPIAYVDVPRRVELTQTLRHLARECDLAVLLTTHDLDLAVRAADTVWLLVPGDPYPTVRVGAPEDLVLDGHMAAAFHSREVRFDLQRGTFVPELGVFGAARVVGEGPAAIWAGRALEREGFALVGGDVPADLMVEVADGPRWRLRIAGEATEHATIGALVAAARAQLPAVAGSRLEAGDLESEPSGGTGADA